ncbi:hypothetical protein CERSUDRAFT_124796 [Gelatoporia subvermispora B]|uniref:Uncharacterized protein n=1 Tax=Ceriporiopsis subvermispora (strain B) TaxID=914234 RepID=M2QTU7_CERS8|nr:hypothetical protein CERSUDRAFT_124796 [Gelatoporia subvermispora B]
MPEDPSTVDSLEPEIVENSSSGLAEVDGTSQLDEKLSGPRNEDLDRADVGPRPTTPVRIARSLTTTLTLVSARVEGLHLWPLVRRICLSGIQYIRPHLPLPMPVLQAIRVIVTGETQPEEGQQLSEDSVCTHHNDTCDGLF